MRHNELVDRLRELDQAVVEHARWYARINRQLICDETPADDDLVEDAHIRCQFGKWFAGPGQARFGLEPCYNAIVMTHEAMHGVVRHLLMQLKIGGAIAGADYDALVAVASRFRQLLRRLDLELTERMGAVDKLTGVWNRQAVHLRLAEETERVQRSRQACSLCFIDLDRFADLNERLGSKNGDRLIQSVVAFFKARLRGYDTLFRMGGEEFLICLPDTELDNAAQLINRLREDFAAQQFDLDDERVSLTASFGLVALEPIFFVDELLERAERAQMIASRQGGNQVCVWRDRWTGENIAAGAA